MQKLDFVKNLKVLVERLQSEKIVAQFNEGFINPAQQYNYNSINPLLFLSKSNYDQIKENENYNDILNSLNAFEVYKEQNLANLTTLLIPTHAVNIIGKRNALNFYNFHNTLLTTYNLAKNILVNKNLDIESETSLSEGIIIFQILIEGEGLETEKYIKIFSALQDLIETVGKIVGEGDEKQEIILLDSGSDTNAAIKTGIETAGSLFLIFKEIWGFLTNHRFYKNDLKNKALLDSLSIREVIAKKVEDGIITEEEGKEYMHKIKSRTDDLIGMNVLPKKLVMESNLVENKKLLKEFDGLKLLMGGEG